MIFRILPTALAVLVIIFSLLSCDSDNLTDPTPVVEPTLRITLTDAPGDYQKVLIDVADVQIRFDGEWIDLDTDYTGQYDLLELTNGLDTVLATSEVPAGTLTEVRLILGADNFVLLNGEEELTALRTPSAQQSGLKIGIENGTIVPGQAYELLLDFDACRSIVRAGNSGNYNLRPRLRAVLNAVDTPTSGQLVGILQPAQEQYVFAYQAGGDTLGTVADSTGLFRLVGVPAGVYTLEVTPHDSATYGPFLRSNISVAPGELVDLGTIDLE